MKKFLIYLIGFILICFIIPAIFTKRTESTSSNVEKDKQQITGQNEENKDDKVDKNNAENGYTYKKYGTITLLHKKTGEIQQVNLDEYLCNVVSAEMPASFESSALEAQSIVARTYTIFKILNKKHDNADICDDSTCCQAWISKEDRLARWEESSRESNWQKICNAVNNTKGKIVTYENQPINAFFHSNSGGTTEIPLNVWGGSGYPYLQSVQTAGEEGYSQYQSEVELSHNDILEKIKSKYNDINIDFSNEENIKILEYTESGRVKTVRFGNHDISGVETRSIFSLKSTNFEISRSEGKIKFSVKGYGHGVGMSQTGADAMAKQGSSSEDIIKHFYTGVEINDVNSL